MTVWQIGHGWCEPIPARPLLRIRRLRFEVHKGTMPAGAHKSEFSPTPHLLGVPCEWWASERAVWPGWGPLPRKRRALADGRQLQLNLEPGWGERLDLTACYPTPSRSKAGTGQALSLVTANSHRDRALVGSKYTFRASSLKASRLAISSPPNNILVASTGEAQLTSHQPSDPAFLLASNLTS